MDAVVAWLEGPEGERWRENTIDAVGSYFGAAYSLDCFSTGLGEASDCVVNPAHDPCGRPPMGP